MEETLVQKLQEQHKQIDLILNSLSKEINSENVDAVYVFDNLQKFNNILTEHLKLEDENFYPKLLETLEEKKENTDEIKEFIEQMDRIVKQVKSFLNFYDSVDMIKQADNTIMQFEFEEMMNDLETRINVENLFVYKKMLEL